MLRDELVALFQLHDRFSFFFFFFNDTATTEIYTLALHDALPIYTCTAILKQTRTTFGIPTTSRTPRVMQASIRIDRKSTRLNSSHTVISYAVFCLKKKKLHRSRTDHDAGNRLYHGHVDALSLIRE